MLYTCKWPFYQYLVGIAPNYTAVMSTCNLARNRYDVDDAWPSINSILSFYRANYQEFAAYQGPWTSRDVRNNQCPSFQVLVLFSILTR